MVKKLIVTCVSAAVMTLSAAGSYHFTISKDVSAAGKQLKAGDYKVEMKGDVAVLKGGGQTVEIPAHVETTPNKFNTTSVMYANESEIKQVTFGGTHTKIVFATPDSTTAAQ